MSEEKAMTPEELRLMQLEAGVDEALHKINELVAATESVAKAGLQSSAALTNKMLTVRQEVTALGDALRAHALRVEELVRQVEADKAPVFCWLTALDFDEMREAEGRVEKFALEILAHHTQGILNDCWRRHPMVVEQLLTLSELFDQSYSGEFRGRPAQRVEFWQRYFPTAIKMIREELGTCSLQESRHNDYRKYTTPRQVGKDTFESFDQTWIGNNGRSFPAVPTDTAREDSRVRREAAHARRYDE